MRTNTIMQYIINVSREVFKLLFDLSAAVKIRCVNNTNKKRFPGFHVAAQFRKCKISKEYK